MVINLYYDFLIFIRYLALLPFPSESHDNRNYSLALQTQTIKALDYKINSRL